MFLPWFLYRTGNHRKSLKMNGTVRQGFEPWVPFKGYNALAKRRFRPLSHLTKTLVANDQKVFLAHFASIGKRILRTLPTA